LLELLEDESSNCQKKPKENSTEPLFFKSLNIPVGAFVYLFVLLTKTFRVLLLIQTFGTEN